MTTQIKVCGLRSVRDIEIINQYDINYAGFIFASGSKRQLTVELAKQMREKLRSDIKAVGVFTYTAIEEVNRIAALCGLDIIQLHSDESPELCVKANFPVWKAISIKSDQSLKDIEKYAVDGILLDTYKPGSLGGNGETFNWNVVNGVSDKYFTILAGGLDENNVNKAIDSVRPHVVDVCSGVESNIIKDEEKIKNFVRRVHNGTK